MKNKAIVSLLALMLCMSALFIPMTAYAASDTDKTPPTVSAWLTGDTLHIEAADDNSGVDAVYVDGQRINYLVNGAVDVKLKDYAGTGEQVSIYAVDFAGNKSATVEIKNPYYKKPAETSAPEPAQPAPTTPAPSTSTPAPSTSGGQSQGGNSGGSSTSTPSPSTSTPAPSGASDSSESAIPDGSNPLTPEGQAAVVDNATEDEGKEFFTFETPDGNVFYLVVDRQREGQNVYFLNAVTEADLMALAESDGSTPGESAIPTPQPEPTPQPTPDPEPEPEPEPEKGGGIGSILLIILALAGVGGAGYYFKILKPKQQAASFDGDDDFEDDEYGEDSEDMDFDAEDNYLPDDDYSDSEIDEDTEDASYEEKQE